MATGLRDQRMLRGKPAPSFVRLEDPDLARTSSTVALIAQQVRAGGMPGVYGCGVYGFGVLGYWGMPGVYGFGVSGVGAQRRCVCGWKNGREHV